MTTKIEVEIVNPGEEWRLSCQTDNVDTNNAEEYKILSVDVEFDYWIEDNSFDYEYGSIHATEHMPPYPLCDNEFDWDKSKYTDVQNDLIYEYLMSDNGQEDIYKAIDREIKDQEDWY